MNAHEPIVILAGIQADGVTYELHPLSRHRLRAAFPQASPAPRIFIGHETKEDFERQHGRMGSQIVTLLTGLDLTRLGELGGVVIRVPGAGREMPIRP